METLDYGYHGDCKLNTVFWCYITDVLHDGMIVVKTEDGARILIETSAFHRVGNLLEHIVEINRYSEHGLDITSEKRAIQIKAKHIDGTVFETEKYNNFAECYLDIVLHLKEHYEEMQKKPEPIAVWAVPFFPSMYVTLVSIEDPAMFNGMGSFTKGYAYPVIAGMLMDENGECCADQIESIEDLNTRDKDVAIWEVADLSDPRGYYYHINPANILYEDPIKQEWKL